MTTFDINSMYNKEISFKKAVEYGFLENILKNNGRLKENSIYYVENETVQGVEQEAFLANLKEQLVECVENEMRFCDPQFGSDARAEHQKLLEKLALKSLLGLIENYNYRQANEQKDRDEKEQRWIKLNRKWQEKHPGESRTKKHRTELHKMFAKVGDTYTYLTKNNIGSLCGCLFSPITFPISLVYECNYHDIEINEKV